MGKMLATRQVRTEAIRCPSCKAIETANVEQSLGWPYYLVFVHECRCGYIITESEWERAGSEGAGHG